MFGFIKQVFIGLLGAVVLLTIKCLSLNDQPCRIRHKIVAINSNQSPYYLLRVSGNKCSVGCNGIDNLYTRLFNRCCYRYECKTV